MAELPTERKAVAAGARAVGCPHRPLYTCRSVRLENGIGHIEARTDGDVGPFLVLPDQSARPVVPVFGRDFNLQQPNLPGRLHVRREDFNPDDADVQGLTAVDHGEEVLRREVTDHRGVEVGVQVLKSSIDPAEIDGPPQTSTSIRECRTPPTSAQTGPAIVVRKA
jgi:hypothetical protein